LAIFFSDKCSSKKKFIEQNTATETKQEAAKQQHSSNPSTQNRTETATNTTPTPNANYLLKQIPGFQLLVLVIVCCSGLVLLSEIIYT
jgi:hypothetical protein